MRRPAVWRFGACIAAVAVAACWNVAQPSPAQPVSNEAMIASSPSTPSSGDRSARYWCTISERGYTYPQFPCVIEPSMGTYRLVKLSGSQRFTGTIRFQSTGGFAFHGKFFCPFGACDQPLDGRFQPARGGGFVGLFSNSDITVNLSPVADRQVAWDAAGAGGNTYGGAGYGGFTYGGNSYGGGTIPRP